MVDLTKEAFDLADYYRNLVIIAADGILGQMMEPVEFPPYEGRKLEPKIWAASGAQGRPKNNVISYYLTPEIGEAENKRWGDKMSLIKANEQHFVEYEMDDADYAFVAFGTSARIAESAVDMLREEGIKVGLYRPVTLWPFPEIGMLARVNQIKGWMSIELSAGQMVEDVKLVINGRAPVSFYGRQGGMTPEPEEVVAAFKAQLLGGSQI